MKLLLALFLFGLACASNPPQIVTVNGPLYEYEYSSYAENWISGTGPESTGLRMNATVQVAYSRNSDLAILRIVNPIIQNSFWSVPHATKNYSQWQQFEELEIWPLLFKLEEGVLIEIYPHPEEKENIVNIKRGIVSAFQVKPSGSSSRRVVEETDVLGTCKTEVTESVIGENVVILKKKNTEECEGRPLQTILPLSQSQEAKFVYGSVVSDYDVVDGIIRTANIQQFESFSPLSKEAGSAVTRIRQSFILTTQKPTTKTESLIYPGRSLNFRYSLQVDEARRECFGTAALLIDSLVNKTQPHDVPHLFIKLIEVLKGCSLSQLQLLRNKYTLDVKKRTFFLDALAYVGTEPALELITTIVTSPTSNSHLSSSRIWDLSLSLSFLPAMTTHPCLVLKYALNIAKVKPDSMTPTLVLGGVINKVLEMPDCWCMEDVSQAINFLTKKVSTNLDKLPSNFTPTSEEFRTRQLWPRPQPRPVEIWENVIHAIKALGNAGTPQTIQLLSEVMYDTRLQTEGRAAAVYALNSASRRTPLMVQSIAKTIFLNTTQEQEIRVAAFVTYIHTLRYDVPEELYDLIHAVTLEKTKQLKSFACTYLIGISRSEDPSLYTQRRAIVYYLKRTGLFLTCPVQDDHGYFSSKATRQYVSLADAYLPRSLPRDVMGMGFSLGVLSTDASWVPRAVNGKLTTNLFGYDIDLLEVGLRGTGIERLFQHVFGPTGYLRKGTRDISPCGLDRGSKDCKFNVDLSEENITGSVYLKFLNQEIGWKHLEQGNIMRKLYGNAALTSLRETITDVIFGHFDFGDIADITHRLSNYFDFAWNGKFRILHHKKDITKTVRLVDIKRVIPTVLGMPLNLAVKAAGHVQLDNEAEISYLTVPISSKIRKWFSSSGDLQSQPDKIEGWGKISPKFSVWSEVDLTLDAFKWQPRLVAFANITSNFTQQVNITLTDDWKLTVKVLEMPENETKILNASYVQFAEVNDVIIPLGIKKRNKTMLYDPVGADLLKLTLWSNISYPNSTGVTQAPFFPLSGAANLSLALQRHEDLESIELSLYNKSSNSLDNGHFDFEVTPVGTNAGIKGYSKWWIDSNVVPPRKVVETDLNSLPVNLTSIFYGNTKKRMDIEGSIELVTEVSHTIVDLAFNRSHFHGVMNRTRHSPEPWNLASPLFEKPIITIPEFTLQVNGLLANNSDGYTSVMLYVEGSEQPQWLRANYTIRKLMVNVSSQSSLFNHTNFFYILPYPIKSPVCHVFDSSFDSSLNSTHIVTFDGLRLGDVLNPNCEYVLARHRHINDTFAVTKKGNDVTVYINGTRYTLTGTTEVKVNDVPKQLPYKEKHVIYVRQVERNGYKYIRLSAWAGVDIYYSDGDIQLAVNGFYINQTAGLCGNANYNSQLEDELVLPDIKRSALSVQEFTRSWSQCCSQPIEVPQPSQCTPNPTDYSLCNLYFWEILTEAHFHVAPYQFYNACLSDVQSCLSPLPSIRAYIQAAHAKEIALSGCHYDGWSPWSDCESILLKQNRERDLIDNRFREACSDLTETRSCKKQGSCKEMKKKKVETNFSNKICRSTRKQPTCPDWCQASYEERQVQFQCIEPTESQDKADNKSPIYLQYKQVISCEDYKEKA